ncbi:GAF domain-containing sensor histidine kinase [Actinoplanes sp. TBRC 11911]|uniref:sensor histidine kinase n=1 Tax=Actinoplanes sp. TBRC 11911 TaxID=2729386 RepID=UPI00145EA298|nr:GAF domain-containing sensor histidine kinase [Actinoplanes sp. TBRC 11911]NMO51556.1 GAF domain-containing sensor histidine kinase [Actinoplanes sp. TBRC 11911]
MTTAYEQQRLAALHQYRLLDKAEPGDDLDGDLRPVVRLAAMVAGVPAAAVHIIDEHVQRPLVATGFEAAVVRRTESLCAVRLGEFVHRHDARLDPAYAVKPPVTSGTVTFYAAAPLVTRDGYALGSLCVFHDEPRELTEDQVARLNDLAAVVMGLLERRRQARFNAELVTELREKHEELRRAHADRAATIAELRRSNSELEQFAVVVSHDLAAPLTVVKGYLEVLGDDVGEHDPRATACIAASTRAVDRMQRLISSLLSYAQAGNAPCRREPAALGELVEQAITDLRGQLDDATIVVAPDLPVLDADPILIRQLLQNLIGNALKYRRADRAGRIEIGAERGAGEWRITIADNGVGIPAAQRRRVFDMFTQVDPSARTGHGVGLSTCQRIVDRHGGRIGVLETPGGGTTMIFTLPATVAAADLAVPR